MNMKPEPANVIPPGPRPQCPGCGGTNLLTWPDGHPQRTSCVDCHAAFEDKNG